jgi:hypothetical protein
LMNSASPESVYEELLGVRFVQESGANISYHTERAQRVGPQPIKGAMKAQD